jgi:hypothetical protein
MSDDTDIIDDDTFAIEMADDQTERAFNSLDEMDAPTPAIRVAQLLLIAAAVAIRIAEARHTENGSGESQTTAPDEDNSSN